MLPNMLGGKRTGHKIIYKLLLVPVKMMKTDYRLSLSLITTKSSEKNTKSSYLRALKSHIACGLGTVKLE